MKETAGGDPRDVSWRRTSTPPPSFLLSASQNILGVFDGADDSAVTEIC